MVGVTSHHDAVPSTQKVLALALIGNMIWINISETARYFLVVRPMLRDAFPGVEHIAAITPGIFAIWVIWDTILIIAATGFYWLHLAHFGATLGQAVIAATCLTVTLFGLLWLGIANMGLAPLSLLWAALPLALIEQTIAALIVRWAMKRGTMA
jgi:hypothetical protein